MYKKYLVTLTAQSKAQAPKNLATSIELQLSWPRRFKIWQKLS